MIGICWLFPKISSVSLLACQQNGPCIPGISHHTPPTQKPKGSVHRHRSTITTMKRQWKTAICGDFWTWMFAWFHSSSRCFCCFLAELGPLELQNLQTFEIYKVFGWSLLHWNFNQLLSSILVNLRFPSKSIWGGCFGGFFCISFWWDVMNIGMHRLQLVLCLSMMPLSPSNQTRAAKNTVAVWVFFFPRLKLVLTLDPSERVTGKPTRCKSYRAVKGRFNLNWKQEREKPKKETADRLPFNHPFSGSNC